MIVFFTTVFLMFPFGLLLLYKKLNIHKNPIIAFFFDEKSIDLIINIFITIAGVTLALMLTNYDSRQQDVDKTISLLSAVYEEVETVQDHIEQFYLPAYDPINISEEEQEFVTLYQAQPLIEVYTLDSVLDSELILSNTNQYSYMALIDMRRSITAHYNALLSITDDTELITELKWLLKSVKLTKEIIENEIMFQSGKVSSNRMKTNVNFLYEQILTE